MTDEFQEEPARNRTGLKWALGAFVVVLVLLAGVYVASYFIAGNQVPSKAEVEGVAIGGMSPGEARSTLETELGPRYEAPLTLTSSLGASAEIHPAEAGMTADFEQAVVDAGGGFSWNPADILDTLTGGGPVDLPLAVDQEQLRASVEALGPEFRVDAVDATLDYEGAQIVRTDGEDAAELDVDATTPKVEEAYLAREDQVAAELTFTPPAITTEMVQQEVDEFAAPAISGPITVTVGEDGSVQITPEQIAEAITFRASPQGFEHEVDTDAILEATAEARSELPLAKARDASYKLESGTISVVPGVEGLEMTDEAFVEAFMGVLTSTDERTAAAEVSSSQPEFTTEEAEALKPTEIIGEFTTRYPHANYRNTNIGRAAQLINGTVLLPGETFSFNDTLGRRTADNGFVDGYVIEGGHLVRAAGGGVSQAATTAFNAGFFAGFEDVEHKPHSLYFPRYPAGREATVVWGAVDLKFRNDTQYPAVMQSFINSSSPGSQGSMTVRVWSQKTWERVTATETQRSNYTSGGERVVTGDRCEPQAPIQGFTASYQRLFWQNGEVAKREDFRWTYSAGDRIRCE